MRAKELLKGYFDVITLGAIPDLKGFYRCERHWDRVRNYQGPDKAVSITFHLDESSGFVPHDSWLVLS